MKNFRPAIATTLAIAAMTSVAYAKVEINGNVEQTTTATYSPQTVIAGAGATARIMNASVDGNVAIRGNLKQTVTLKYSPQTVIAGAGATAEILNSTIRGR